MSIKIAAAALSAIGITGTGGIFLYRHLTKTTVRQELQKETNRKILDNSQSESQGWSKIISENNDSKKEKLKAFVNKYHSVEETSVGDITEEKLKKACEKALEEVSNKEKVDTARDYCTTST